MKILVINGPNLNMLGIREPEIYGSKSYAELCSFIEECCMENGCECSIFQSNHEGAIIDRIQQAYGNDDAIIINAGGYTHTSVAIADALRAVNLPAVEVHLSDIHGREDFRRVSYIESVAEKSISGLGFDGYRMAVEYLTNGNKF